MSLAAADLELLLADLSPVEMDELGYLLRGRAARARRMLSVEEARAAIAAATLGPEWEGSCLRDVGRVRTAAKDLIPVAGWRPDQIVVGLTEAGLEIESDLGIVAYATAYGIEDARWLLS